MTGVQEETILEARDVRVSYAHGRRRFGRAARRPQTFAVDGVSFSVRRGRTLGLVGESGCGKSTLGRTLIGYLAAASGSIRFEGTELTGLRKRDWKPVRSRLQMVFQDPYASLNPSMRVRDIIAEPLRVHGRYDAAAADRVQQTAERVGLTSRQLDRYPRQFSGGQRQRIGIARALVLDPSLLVLDEPVSALDVSVQAQIITLLQDLQEERGLTYVFVAHDLSVVKHISHDIAVMNQGRIVEQGPAEQVFGAPRDDYTRRLLSAIPIADPRLRGHKAGETSHHDQKGPAR